MLYFSKSFNFDDRMRFCGHFYKIERPMKLPMSDYSHILDHVKMVNATKWSLFMFQWHFMKLFHFNILQDMK